MGSLAHGPVEERPISPMEDLEKRIQVQAERLQELREHIEGRVSALIGADPPSDRNTTEKQMEGTMVGRSFECLNIIDNAVSDIRNQFNRL